MNIIGIDPGANGAIAVFYNEGIRVLALKDATELDVFEFLDAFSGPGGTVFLEQVSSSPQQGVVSAFSFGVTYGGLRMAVIATRLRLETVLPRKWQSFMKINKIGGGFGMNDTAKKRATKARAQELFPHIKITNATADALLLMEYGRLTLGVHR